MHPISFLCLLVVTIGSTLTLPVILKADFLQPNMSTEFSQLLTFHNVRYLFNATFQAALSLVSVHVGKIALTLCVLALVHLVVVYRRTYNTVSYFQRGIFWAR